MNTHFDDLAASVAAATRWDAGTDMLDAIASYRNLKESMPPITPPDSTHDFAKLVLAGSRACTLASLTINHTRTVPMLQDIAKQVMADWGLEIKEIPPPPEEAVAPSNELVWPPVELSGRPLTSKLSPAYFEATYYLHEPHQLIEGTIGYAVQPQEPLRLLSAYWDEPSYMWRLEMLAALTSSKQFWVGHCKLRPEAPPSTVPHQAAT